MEMNKETDDQSGYKMEELLPVLAELAEKVSGCESSSMPYEKAEQLMGAILYCIREAEGAAGNALITGEKLPAAEMYKLGCKAVKEKVERTIQRYHEILPEFEDYGNRCLHDTFVLGIPEFFKWYDMQTNPQNTILTLDYPVMRERGKSCGIDAISEYVDAIYLEQLFLSDFSREYVLRVLRQQSSDYRELIQNVTEVVLEDVLLRLIVGRSLDQSELTQEDREQLTRYQGAEGRKKLQNTMEGILEKMTDQYYGASPDLLAYLNIPVSGIAARISCRAGDAEIKDLLY
jgi:hypothetical protein